MSSNRRTFLLHSSVAVAGLLLPKEFFGNQRTETPSQALAFTGGHWFDGQIFRDHTHRGDDLYAVAGIFTTKRPAHIDSTIELKDWFILPPFGEAHNHNLDFSDEEQWSRIKAMYLRDGIFYIKNPTNLARAAAPLAGRINIPTSVDAVFAH